MNDERECKINQKRVAGINDKLKLFSKIRTMF
jgi:hypothetical protein